MAIVAKNSGGGNHEPAPAGNHAARCVSMIQIGTVEDTIQGVTKTLHKVRLTFELPEEQKVFKEENGMQPHLISKEYTLSMHEKASLRKDLESWRGKAFTEDEAKAFDIVVLLGKPCMLNVIHATSAAGSTYAKISSISSVPKSLKVPEQITPATVLSYDKFDWDLFNSLPDFLKDKIKSSEEFRKLQQPQETEAAPAAANGNHDDDEVPYRAPVAWPGPRGWRTFRRCGG